MNLSLPKGYMPSPENFYPMYEFFDGAENLLSFGAAIPWVGSVFANLKIITGAALIALGLLMNATASLPFFSQQITVNLIENSYVFIAHGVGAILAGYLERYVLLGTLLWGVRVAIRTVDAKNKGKKISTWDWVLQRKLFKFMRYKIENPPLSLDTPKNGQRAINTPRNPQRASESPRNPQRASGSPRNPQKATESPRNPPREIESPKNPPREMPPEILQRQLQDQIDRLKWFERHHRLGSYETHFARK